MSVAGIAVPEVTRWLADHVPGLVPPVRFEPIVGGRSNLTYRVTDAVGSAWALRRPPTGGVLATAHDMSREWRFLRALAPTAVPVPAPVAYCADTEVTGASFYVMGFVDGLVLADERAGGQLAEPVRRRAGLSTVDVLVALHRLDPAEVGLADLARPGSYVERQLRRWHRQVHQSAIEDLRVIDEVYELLLRRLPAATTGVVHGDFRLGNLAVGPDGEVVAVFDWELATLGEPLADLGWLLSTWAEPGDPYPPTTPGPSALPGFPRRAELVRRYAAGSGRSTALLDYYVAFARWRSACIGAGVYTRYRAGVMGTDEDTAGRASSVHEQAEAARLTLSTLQDED